MSSKASAEDSSPSSAPRSEFVIPGDGDAAPGASPNLRRQRSASDPAVLSSSPTQAKSPPSSSSPSFEAISKDTHGDGSRRVGDSLSPHSARDGATGKAVNRAQRSVTMSPKRASAASPRVDRSNPESDGRTTNLATTMKVKFELDRKEAPLLHSRAREEDYGHIYTGSTASKYNSPDLAPQSSSGSSLRALSPLDTSFRDARNPVSPRLAASAGMLSGTEPLTPLSSQASPRSGDCDRASNNSFGSAGTSEERATGQGSAVRDRTERAPTDARGVNFSDGASPRHSSETSFTTGASAPREEDYPSFSVNRSSSPPVSSLGQGGSATLSLMGASKVSPDSRDGEGEEDTRSEANKRRRVQLPEGSAANKLLFGGDDKDYPQNSSLSSSQTSGKVLLMGPDEAGDVIVCVRKGFDEEQQQEVVAALLSSRLLLKVRHLELLQDFAANEGQDEYVECSCNCCYCCRFKCREQDMCCLMNCANKLICGLMPACLVQHDVQSSGLAFVVFVGASVSRLNEEHLLLQRERWARSNSLSVTAVNEIKYRDVFTPGERSQLLYRIVERAIAPRSGIALRKHPAVKSITVLHDPSFLVKLLQWHPETLEVSKGVHKRWEDATYIEQFTNHFSTYVNGSVMAHEMRPITKQTIEYGGRQLPKGQMFIHELRAQYGEKVAYLFAYNRFFVHSLYYILVPGLAVQIVHFIDGTMGRRLNTIFGLFVSCVWSPLFQVMWDRTAAEYAFMWNVNTINFQEADYPNPDFTGEERIDPITQQKIRFYPQWKRAIQYSVRVLLLILFYVVWLWAGEWIIMIFVSLRSRFDDPPWLAVSILKDIIHGTLMAGLGNAIFHGWAWALVNCENYETEGKRDKHLIYTFFAMDFWNMFVLLFLLAFFFIPLKHGGWYAHAFHVEGTPLNQLWWSLFDTPVHNATVIQGRLDWEKMEIVMIGPIVVMRILITITMSVLPFCMQRRRRAAVRKAMAQRSAHLKEWFTTVTFLVKPAKWARSKVIGTAVEVGKGVRDRTYSMSASVGKTLARSTSFMRQSTTNSMGSDGDTNFGSRRSGSFGSDSPLSDESSNSPSDVLSLPGDTSRRRSRGSSDLEHGGPVLDAMHASPSTKVSDPTEEHHSRTLSTIQSVGSFAEKVEELRTSPTRVLKERSMRTTEEQGAAVEKNIEMTAELSSLSYSLTDLDNSMASRQSDFAWAEKTPGDEMQFKHTLSDHWMGNTGKKMETLNLRARLQAITILQQYHRAHRARSIVFERRMALKSADDLVEECGAGEFEMFFIYVDLLMQYGILTFFICAAPWIVVIMAAVGAFEIRIRTYNLAYASRPPQPRKAANIGPWRECLRFLARMALPVNGLVMTLSMGLLDSWFDCPGEHKSQQFLDPRMYKLWMYISTLASMSWDDGTFDDNMINEEQCVSYTTKFIFFGAVVMGGFIMHQVVYWIVPQRPQWVTDQIKLRLHQQKQHFLRQHPKRGKLPDYLINRHMDKAWAMLETAKYSKRGAVVRGDWTQNVNDMEEYQNLTERVLGRSSMGMGSDKRRGSGADAGISASVADAVARSHASAGASQLGLRRSSSDPNLVSGRIRSTSQPTTVEEEEGAMLRALNTKSLMQKSSGLGE